ncbi:MAG: hypothetical protein H7099_08210 [Gemmatimonadaceae bacterium]|nr:hypothetical protein [Gemmatimonadaceae bacterium]
MITCCCVLSLATVAQGQTSLTVRPIQNLSFGFLLPGVPSSVDAATVTRSGQIQVEAPLGTNFQVRYTLPTVMNGPGTTMPLTFGTTDGGAAPTANPASMQRFNPATATRWQLVTTTRATFFLGGRAAPRVGQPVGGYTAPIIVTITNLGV